MKIEEYDLCDLVAVAKLMKEHNITPECLKTLLKKIDEQIEDGLVEFMRYKQSQRRKKK